MYRARGQGPGVIGLGRPRCCWRSPRGARGAGVSNTTVDIPPATVQGPRSGTRLARWFARGPFFGNPPPLAVRPGAVCGRCCGEASAASRWRGGGGGRELAAAEPDLPARTGTCRLGADSSSGGHPGLGPPQEEAGVWRAAWHLPEEGRCSGIGWAWPVLGFSSRADPRLPSRLPRTSLSQEPLSLVPGAAGPFPAPAAQVSRPPRAYLESTTCLPALTQLPFLGLTAGIYPQAAGPSPLGPPGCHKPTTTPSYNSSRQPRQGPSGLSPRLSPRTYVSPLVGSQTGSGPLGRATPLGEGPAFSGVLGVRRGLWPDVVNKSAGRQVNSSSG